MQHRRLQMNSRYEMSLVQDELEVLREVNAAMNEDLYRLVGRLAQERHQAAAAQERHRAAAALQPSR